MLNKNLFIIILVNIGVFFSNFLFPDEKNAQNSKYSIPYVLSIPGFMVPGKSIPQEKHFGNLKELIEKMGIPYKCIVYNSKEIPLSEKSGLITEKYSIASTRVIPEIVYAIEREIINRKKMKLNPLEDVVIIGYSQGALIGLQVLGQFYKYKTRYDEYMKAFGNEFQALTNDPVYKELLFASEVYQSFLNIKYQNEKEFKRNRDLQIMNNRLRFALNNKFDNLEKYIINPELVYPGITDYDTPQTSKYPKKYNLLKDFFFKNKDNRQFQVNFTEFVSENALFQSLKNIKFRIICLSGSIFGSPEANIGYDLLHTFNFLKSIIKGSEQIQDTRLGSAHHVKGIETLISFKTGNEYPLNNKNCMFIVGANDDKGDGFVEQPCGHLSGHQYAEIDTAKYKDKLYNGKTIYIKKENLPSLRVIPLKVSHFPIKTFLGLRKIPGSAYIEKEEHPSFKYIKGFIEKDFSYLDNMEKNNTTIMRQFMVEFTIGKIDNIKRWLYELNNNYNPKELNDFIKSLGINIKLINKPSDIYIQSRFFNKDNFTFLYIGSFDANQMFFNKGIDIKKEHNLDFIINAKGYPEILISLPVKAGKITFIRVIDTDYGKKSRHL